MLILLSFLHPGIGEQQARAIFLAVGELAREDGIALVCHTTLQYMVASDDGI